MAVLFLSLMLISPNGLSGECGYLESFTENLPFPTSSMKASIPAITVCYIRPFYVECLIGFWVWGSGPESWPCQRHYDEHRMRRRSCVPHWAHDVRCSKFIHCHPLRRLIAPAFAWAVKTINQAIFLSVYTTSLQPYAVEANVCWDRSLFFYLFFFLFFFKEWCVRDGDDIFFMIHTNKWKLVYWRESTNTNTEIATHFVTGFTWETVLAISCFHSH